MNSKGRQVWQHRNQPTSLCFSSLGEAGLRGSVIFLPMIAELIVAQQGGIVSKCIEGLIIRVQDESALKYHFHISMKSCDAIPRMPEWRVPQYCWCALLCLVVVSGHIGPQSQYSLISPAWWWSLMVRRRRPAILPVAPARHRSRHTSAGTLPGNPSLDLFFSIHLGKGCKKEFLGLCHSLIFICLYLLG